MTLLVTSVAEDESSERLERHATDRLHTDLTRARRPQILLAPLLPVARRYTPGFPARPGLPGVIGDRGQLVAVGRRRGCGGLGGAAVRVEVAQRQRDVLARQRADSPRTLGRADTEPL